jgi:hypothetical protein
VARKILLDALTGQARSRQELAERLARKDVPDELATELLDRFLFNDFLYIKGVFITLTILSFLHKLYFITS